VRFTRFVDDFFSDEACLLGGIAATVATCDFEIENGGN